MKRSLEFRESPGSLEKDGEREREREKAWRAVPKIRAREYSSCRYFSTRAFFLFPLHCLLSSRSCIFLFPLFFLFPPRVSEPRQYDSPPFVFLSLESANAHIYIHHEHPAARLSVTPGGATDPLEKERIIFIRVTSNNLIYRSLLPLYSM